MASEYADYQGFNAPVPQKELPHPDAVRVVSYGNGWRAVCVVCDWVLRFYSHSRATEAANQHWLNHYGTYPY